VQWSRSVDKVNTGSVTRMRWSPDGTQLAAACSNGYVLFANVVDKFVGHAHTTVVSLQSLRMA
jgi:intraflagellar transport protein 80